MKKNVKNRPASTGPFKGPGSGLEKVDKENANVKKEAGHPGGSENAAGADSKGGKGGNDQIGSKPLPTDRLNLGE